MRAARARAGLRLWAMLATIAPLSTSPLPGQTAEDTEAAWGRVDLQATTRRLWHGLTRVSGLAATAQAQVGVRAPLGSVAAGALATWDLCRCLGKVRLLGRRRYGLGELDLWGEYRLGRGDLSVAGGVVHYDFYGSGRRGGIGSGSNSTELYVTAEVEQVYLSPRASVFVDAGPVGGTYLELGGSLPVLGWPYPPFHEVFLEGELGFSVSQGPNADDSTQATRYARNSFTHARVKLGFDLLRRPHTTVPVSFELQANFDEAMKRPRGGPARDLAYGFSTGRQRFVPLGTRRP